MAHKFIHRADRVLTERSQHFQPGWGNGAFVQKLTKVDLLVLEDFGMKRLKPSAAEDLLEIFIRRHEKGSTLITTNRPTEDWGQFLGDVPATTAILDRFLAHAEIVAMAGKSYRLHQRARSQQRENGKDQ